MVGSPAPLVRIGLAGGQGLALAIPDVTAPTVVSFSPADNATGVSVSTNLVATMSEVIVLGAAGIVSLKKTSDNSVIQTWNVATQGGTGAGQVSVVSGTDLTMRLTGLLAPTTEFYVIWDVGVVKDTSNNNVAALSVTTTWSFTTMAADVTAPTVSSFSPLDNAVAVAVATNLVATMSETVVLGTGVITLKKTSDNSTVDSWNVATAGGSTAGKVEVIGSGNALTMHLTASLASATEYYVIWDAGVVQDTSANPIAAQASTTLWSFTTADVIAPAVVSFSPVDNATGVSVLSNLVVTISETVTLGASGVITLKRTSDNGTVDSWNVATAGGSTAGKVEVIGGVLLTMHLTTSLAINTEHYVIWDAGVVKDAASNPIAAQSSTTLWSFTTTAAAWTPASLPGLVAWYRADAGVTTSSGNVTVVADQSGNGNPLGPLSGNVVFNATGLNGRPAFEFTVGNGAYLGTPVNAVPLSGTTGSAFTVGYMRSPTNGGHVVSYNGNGQAVDYASASSSPWIIRDGSNNAIRSHRNGVVMTTGAISLNTNYRWGVIYDSSFCHLYINNVDQVSPVACTDSFTAPGTLYFGNATGGGPWDGFIAEMVITSTAMSSGDRASLDAYFVAKFGI